MQGLTVFLLVVALAVAPARPASAIADGEDARDGAYRFSVLLTMTGLPGGADGRRDSSCSGALVAARWVVTAGHCFRDAGGDRVGRPVARRTTAVIGRADLTSRAGVEAEVVAVHQAAGADVALVELGTAVTGIEPLRVATTPPVPGEVVRLTGYGLTSSDASATTSRLQTGRFLVGAVGDTLVETSGISPGEATSPCPHDSGGPYFRQEPGGGAALVAVVSTGPGCPHPGPDFSARTDNLAAWIARTTEGTGFRGRDLIGYAGGALVAALALLTAAHLRRRRPLDRA